MPDRRTFEDLLDGAILSAKEKSLAVLFVEIEGLQDVRSGGMGDSTHGSERHLDKGLDLFIARMTSRYFPIGRHGRTRFSLVVNDVGASEAKRHASAIIDDLTAAFQRGESHPPVAIQIGLSIYPADGGGVLWLLKKAEIAR